MKRLFDILVSVIFIISFCWLFILIAIIVRAVLGKPVFFSQQRSGKDGKPFVLHKFRTMKISEADNGTLVSDENRMTKLGSFLRRTSLDELPTFWNVLRGEMSLVGPRPLLMEYLELYTNEQKRRQNVLPGITGWAQVNGRNSISWEEKFKLDVWYVENHNIYLDLKILCITIVSVFNSKGITQEGHVTAEKFRGSK